jgi:hypothetical protein
MALWCVTRLTLCTFLGLTTMKIGRGSTKREVELWSDGPGKQFTVFAAARVGEVLPPVNSKFINASTSFR